MVEKKLFVQALKHYCDTIWEYEKLSDCVYVHCDKIAEEAEGKAYTLAELIRLFRETYHFTTGDSLWESYLNEAYLQSHWNWDAAPHFDRINSWLVAWPGAFRLETLRKLDAIDAPQIQ